MFGGWTGSQKEAPGVMFSLRDKLQSDTAQAEQEEQTVDYCMTLRTSDMQWVCNKFIGVPASKRYGHTATAIGPHLIIIGGWDGGKPLNDVIVLRDRSAGEGGDEAASFEEGQAAQDVPSDGGADGQEDSYDPGDDAW